MKKLDPSEKVIVTFFIMLVAILVTIHAEQSDVVSKTYAKGHEIAMEEKPITLYHCEACGELGAKNRKEFFGTDFYLCDKCLERIVQQ